MTDTVSYKIKGGKIGILLLHRLCGTPVEMRFVANGLARQGYTVHCPRLAGHCGSDAEIKASSWVDWYRGAEAALDELCRECDTVIVGGLSTGAVLALMLAAKHPNKVQATTLLAPTMWLNGFMIPWYARLFRLVPSKWVAGFFHFAHHAPYGIKDHRIRDFIEKSRASRGSAEVGHAVTPGAMIYEHRQLVRAVTKLVPYVRQPTLIMHPLEDDYAGMSNAIFLRNSLPGDVDLQVLDDCHHLVTVDRQRHVVVEAMCRFVGALSGATPAAVKPAEVVAIRAAA